MEKRISLLLLLVIFAVLSCEDGTSTQQEGTNSDSTAVDTVTTSEEGIAAVPIARPDCKINGSVMEGNSFWAKTENLIVTIAATSESEDADLGESHRVLSIYDGKNCEEVFHEVLPVNISPDYAYRLTDITYNNVSKVVAVRGVDKIYILDLVAQKRSEALTPKFLSARLSEDGQSGMIQRLEIWENYLVGYASGSGTFVFDLENPMAASPVLPAAEFEVDRGSEYNSMFFLASKGEKDKCQAVLPVYDLNTGEFSINPMFDEPLEIQQDINPTFRNNRFIVLKENTENRQSSPVGIDMKSKKRLEIPSNIATKKDTEIISWMKNQ